MLKDIKEAFRSHIQEITGKTVYDTGAYHDENDFPFLKLRLHNLTARHARDLVMSNITYTLDIFTRYSGEQEIIEIVDEIIKSLPQFIENNNITYCYLNRLQILDDNETGPLRKHGVANFTFIITGGLADEDGE